MRRQIVGKKIAHPAAVYAVALPVCGIATAFSNAISAGGSLQLVIEDVEPYEWAGQNKA